MDSKSGSGVIVENPFSLKVGQVFTGFGIGCGFGIGVGRPLNLAGIPMLNQVMVATRGATNAFSGVGRNVNNSLRRLGAKNIEVGIGCGIGFGHGFGIGLAVKPGVAQKIQSCLTQLAAKAMMKFGPSFNMPVVVAQGIVPKSIQSGNPLGNIMPLQSKAVENLFPKDGNLSSFSSSLGTPDLGKNPSNASHSSRMDTVISNFLQNPLLKDRENSGHELVERLTSENNLLQMVLKHQQAIEELTQQNQKLREILVEDLKVSPSKLRDGSSSSSGGGSKSPPCTDCFECRRRQRRR